MSTEAAAGRRLFVGGAADGYPRRRDVELQLRYRNPELVVHRDLRSTVEDALATAGLG